MKKVENSLFIRGGHITLRLMKVFVESGLQGGGGLGGGSYYSIEKLKG